MSEKCKYCNYVSRCSQRCEYNSLLCKINRSFPKVVDKSYEELQKENQKYKEVIDKIKKRCEKELEHSKSDCVPARMLVCEKILDTLKEVE